jgi:FolB domain-containing protein
MDRILVRDLHLRCIIGAHDWERVDKQDVIINLSIWTDLAGPAKTDRLEDAVNYRVIKKNIISMVENSDFHLIETLAEKIAYICLENEKVEKVQVTVDKPGALRFAKSVAVEITREQSV